MRRKSLGLLMLACGLVFGITVLSGCGGEPPELTVSPEPAAPVEESAGVMSPAEPDKAVADNLPAAAAPEGTATILAPASLAQDLLPAACVADPTGISCAIAAFKAGKDAFGTVKAVMTFLGLVDSGPTLDEKVDAIAAQLRQVQTGVAALQTQVADLNVTVAGYATQNVKILVWTRLSDLGALQNDLTFMRLYQSVDQRAETLRYTKNLANFLAGDVLYQDGPNASLGWHTPMYAGMALTQAVSAYASAIEVETSIDPLAWSRAYSFASDLEGFASALRRVSGYAAEWADANVTLTLAPADPDLDLFVSQTRPCPSGTLAVSCGYHPDFVGKVCTCRRPAWELKFNGKLQGTYYQNLAAWCQAPTTPRAATNNCTAYPAYKAVFEQGKANFRAQVGVQDYLDAASLLEAYVARSDPTP